MRSFVPPVVGIALVAVLAGCPPKQTTPEPAVTTTEPSTPEPAVTEPEPEPEPARLSPEEVRRRLDDAVATLTIGTPDAARRAFGILDQIARRDATNPYVFYNLGLAHDILGESAQARRAYEQAIELDPKLGRAYLGLGVLLEQDGKTRDAIATYRKGIEADEADMELRSAVIGALRRQGRLDEAITEAKAALAYNSKSLPVYNDLGLVYIEKGDLSMARFVYLKALSQEGAKNNAPIRTNLGWTLYLSEEPLQARRQLEESYKLDNRYLPTLIYLSHLYLDDHNYTDAVPLLEEALSQEPDNYGVMVNLGVAYRGVGKLEQSKAMYQKAMDARPAEADPYLNMGVLLGDHFKDYDAAIQAFDTYLDKGGSQKELVSGYIDEVEKEKKRAERQKQREEERKKREAEKAERERLLREAEARKQAEGGGQDGGQDEGTDPGAQDGSDGGAEPAPEDDAQPDGTQPDSPWGEQ